MNRLNPYLEHFQKVVIPTMVKSRVMMILLPDKPLDSKICLEVGAAILLDKPMIVLTTSITLVSAALTKLVDEIVIIENLEKYTELDKQKIDKALTRVVEKYSSKV